MPMARRRLFFVIVFLITITDGVLLSCVTLESAAEILKYAVKLRIAVYFYSLCDNKPLILLKK